MFERKFHKRNEGRSRTYGLRIGDIVELTLYKGRKQLVEVVAYSGDNNKVYVRSAEGHGLSRTAEECKLVIKVEDRMDQDVQKEIMKAFEKTNQAGLGFLGSEMKAAIKGVTNLF